MNDTDIGEKIRTARRKQIPKTMEWEEEDWFALAKYVGENGYAIHFMGIDHYKK